MEMKKETRGRPRLSKKVKKVHCNFCVPPQVIEKIDQIKFERSPFIAAVLLAVPLEWVRMYNKSPEAFAEKLKNSEIDLKPLEEISRARTAQAPK
jgi:hypothetical protein